MTLLKYLFGLCSLGAAVLGAASSLAAAPNDLVNARFGTAYNSNQNSNGRDGGSLIQESSDNAVYVAGFVDSRTGDTGGVPSKPMLAKFDDTGQIIWQQVYDRTGWSIIAMNTSGNELSVLFWYPEPGDWYRLDKTNTSYSSHGLVELWSLTATGELDEKRLTLNHQLKQVQASSSPTGFTLLIGKHASENNRHFVRVHSYHYDWNGNKAGQYDKFSLPDMPRLLLDRQGALTDGRADDNVREVVLHYYSFAKKTIVKIPVGNCDRCSFHKAFRTKDSAEILFTRGDHRDPDRNAELLKVNLLTGEHLSHINLPTLSQLSSVTAHETRGGDILVSGQGPNATSLSRLSSKNRQRLWTKHFGFSTDNPRRPYNRHYLSSLTELTDGRLAATGSAYSQPSTGDAFLLVTDEEGLSLSSLETCLEKTSSLEELTRILARRYRIVLDSQQPRGVLFRNVVSRSSGQVTSQNRCPSPTHTELAVFAKKLLDALPPPVEALKTTKTTITLKTIPFAEDSNAYYYVADRNSYKGSPVLLVDLAKPKEVAAEITHSVLPYLANLGESHDSYSRKTRQLFVNGNSQVHSAEHKGFNWQDLALSPRDYADAMNRLNVSYAKLSDSEKLEIRQSTPRRHFVHLLPEPGPTKRTRLGGIYLPASHADTFWQWILSKNSRFEPEIESKEQAFLETFNIVFTQRPASTPEEYIRFLDTLFRAIQHLDRSSVPVEFKFNASMKSNTPGLRITRKDTCTSRAAPGLDVDYIVKWLERMWVCDNNEDS